ncbi:MAG: tyrosine-protein phosphatase [Clostridia bacterium]|nr:tyrosine-protein phosphatase [Clostridia bacterium]
MGIFKKIGVFALTACCVVGGFSACGEEERAVEETIKAVSPKEGKIVVLANDEVAEFASSYESGYNCAEPYYGKGDHYFMKTLTLEWSAKNPADEYEVALSEKSDMSNKTVYLAEEESLTLSDLFVNTTYYWQVKGGEDTSKVFSFKTANTPRTIKIDGVSNTRDIGGKATEDGRMVRQGIVYRGGKLDNITPSGIEAFTNTYKIKTDLDLRKEGEGMQGGSPAGEEIAYYNYSCPYYTGGTAGIDNENNYENLAAAMRVFANADNYPVYIHCSIGRDRTSMVAMLLLGVCGVSVNDISLDYEMSFFSESGCLDGATVEQMTGSLATTMAYLFRNSSTTGTFKDACETYLLQIGLTQAEIDAIRQNMIK